MRKSQKSTLVISEQGPINYMNINLWSPNVLNSNGNCVEMRGDPVCIMIMTLGCLVWIQGLIL